MKYSRRRHSLQRTGVQFGLKFPTGATDALFLEGPVAGEAVERGLQPGTGSTDLLLGAFRYGSQGEKTGWFMQAQGQAPLTSHDAFRPGASLTTTFGVRLLNVQRVVPQLQLNARIEGCESGANADRDNSGAQRIFISLGINLKVSHRQVCTIVYNFFAYNFCVCNFRICSLGVFHAGTYCSSISAA
ncbi:MAG: hypothetical protein ACOY3E_12560 [Pseudomonadota bacterium]